MIVIVTLVALARSAEASCAIEEAYIGTYEIPVGCPLFVYLREPAVTPKAVALRDGARIDVTVSFILERTPVPLFIEDNSCTGEGTTVQYPLHRFNLEIDVREGDVLEVAGAVTAPNERAIVVAATGTCPSPVAPTLACPDDTPEQCEEVDEGGGCATTAPGPAPFALAVGFVGFWSLRRRRRR